MPSQENLSETLTVVDRSSSKKSSSRKSNSSLEPVKQHEIEKKIQLAELMADASFVKQKKL